MFAVFDGGRAVELALQFHAHMLRAISDQGARWLALRPLPRAAGGGSASAMGIDDLRLPVPGKSSPTKLGCVVYDMISKASASFQVDFFFYRYSV